MLFVLLFLVACAPKTERTIARVRFEGNGHPLSLTNDQNLRSAMMQKEVSWVQFLRQRDSVQHFDASMLQMDAWRVENWYASHGYINAKVTGWSVHTKPSRFWFPSQRMIVTGHVEEGEQVNIRSIVWDKDSSNLLQRELDRRLGVSVGDPLNLDTLEYAKDELKNLANNRSYAYASVDISVDVWPSNCYQLVSEVGACLVAKVQADCSQKSESWCDAWKAQISECTGDWCLRQLTEPHVIAEIPSDSAEADVVVHFREGPSCTFGDVKWMSQTTIPKSVLQDQQTFKKGEIYRSSRLSQFQRRLFALNQFSVVTVTPLLTGETTIPVEVVLSERKKREAAVGLGGNVDSGLVSLYTSLDFTHINLGNRLLSLELSNDVGYAAYPNPSSSDLRSGPTLHNVGKLYYPRFLKPIWAVGMEVEYELGIQPAYRFSSPKVAPYWSWKQPIDTPWFSSIDAQVSYYFTGFTYLDVQVENSSLDDVVRLGYLAQNLILDGRNDPMFPKQGRYLSLNSYQATTKFGGDYAYWKAQIDYRRFFPIINLGDIRLPGAKRTLRQWTLQHNVEALLMDGVFSYRFNAGGLLPYQWGDTSAYAPNAEYFFLGGGSDVRGWRAQHLGPYVCSSEPCDGNPNATIVPIGGKVMTFGSVEYRQYFPSDIGFAVFSDLGMVWDGLQDVAFATVQPSVGGGLRYMSPIGPLRFDVGCRVKQDSMFAMEDRCRLHFAFSESY